MIRPSEGLPPVDGREISHEPIFEQDMMWPLEPKEKKEKEQREKE